MVQKEEVQVHTQHIQGKGTAEMRARCPKRRLKYALGVVYGLVAFGGWTAYTPAFAGSQDLDPNSAFFSPSGGGPIIPLTLPPPIFGHPRLSFGNFPKSHTYHHAEPQAAALPPPEMPDRVESAVVVGSRGPLLTDAHALDGCARLAVALPDGTAVPARIVQMDPILDLALLQADIRGGVPIRLRSAPFDRERVWVAGYGQDSPHIHVASGPAHFGRDRGSYSVSTDTHGPEHGAVLDGDGDLAGWVFGVGDVPHSGDAQAIPGSQLRAFLEQASVRLDPADGLSAPSANVVRATPELIVLRVGCFVHPAIDLASPAQ